MLLQQCHRVSHRPGDVIRTRIVTLVFFVGLLAEWLEVGLGALFGRFDDQAHVGLLEGVVVTQQKALLFFVLAWLVLVEEALQHSHVEVHVNRSGDRVLSHVTVPVAVELQAQLHVELLVFRQLPLHLAGKLGYVRDHAPGEHVDGIQLYGNHVIGFELLSRFDLFADELINANGSASGHNGSAVVFLG